MNQAWVLLWLASTPASPEQERQIAAWAERQGQRVTEARKAAGLSVTNLGATATHIEGALERARLALGALDAPAAETALDEARRLLRAHPELPQAAWLFADLLSLEAELLPPGERDAQIALLDRARAGLEGPRSASASSHALGGPVSSEDAPELPSGESAPHEGLVREWIVSGLRPGDEVYWDGALLAPPSEGAGQLRIQAAGDLHHVRVLREGRLAWASWTEPRPDEAAALLQVPAPPACSFEDLAPWLSQGGPQVPILCDRWIAALPTPDGKGVQIAQCHRNQCGAFERWPRAPIPKAALAPQAEEEGRPWLTYTLIGTAVTATAAILLYGLTQRGTEERSVWVYEGVR